MSLHICILCHEYPPERHGGIGANAQALGRALVERGNAVTVIGVSRHTAGVEDDRGVTVMRMPHTRFRGLGFVVNGHRVRRALAEVNRARPIDIVEAEEIGLAILPRRFPITTVLRMNGGHQFFAVTLGESPRPWRSWLERRSFARADHLCAVTRFAAETTRELLRLGDRPIALLPNGVDTDRFHPRGDPEDPNHVVFVGTVCEKKGIRQLIEAMPTVLAEHPEAHLTVAGRDWVDVDGTSFTAGLRTRMAPHLERDVEFLGPVDHDAIPDLLATAAVCVYPSHMEAQGIVLVEAMAAGRAVVASSTGPGPEVIEDGVSGLLCDPHDPASIAKAVSKLLGDTALRKRLGAEARRRAVEQFSVDSLAERNEAFYRACLHQSADR